MIPTNAPQSAEEENVNLGKIVAEQYRKQYFKKNKWLIIPIWEIQPEQIHLILCELQSKIAIDAFMGNDSWTKPQRIRRKKVI